MFLRTEEKKREQAKEKQRNDAAPAAPVTASAPLKDSSNLPAIEAAAPTAVQRNGRESPQKETPETTEGPLEKSSSEDHMNVPAAQDDQVCQAEDVA